MKARIGAQRSKLRIDLYPNHPVAVLAVGLFQPGERLVIIAQRCMRPDERECWEDFAGRLS